MAHNSKRDAYSLLNNSRFYILVSSVLVSVLVFCWLRVQIPSDQLLVIRVQQVFGFLCLVYWCAALAISPIGFIIGKHRMKHIEFARRAIGVSAFYFALLHAGIALWGQLGGLGQLQYLPVLFQWSLGAGFVALVILGVMAATSFDRVVKYMTYKRWKLLHRLVYGAFILVILHVWSIGTHLAYTNIQLTAFVVLVVLSGLELYRFTKVTSDKYFRLSTSEFNALFLAVWLCIVILVASIPVLVQNYHSRHTDHNSSSSHSEVQP